VTFAKVIEQRENAPRCIPANTMHTTTPQAPPPLKGRENHAAMEEWVGRPSIGGGEAPRLQPLFVYANRGSARMARRC
jgi:hypothetical protein